MGVRVPRLVIAGLSGDTGKTIVTSSILAALRRRGAVPAVFKKGPDYIDAAWLTAAAGSACRNLDTFMVPAEQVRLSFARHSASRELAVIEGNRGLYDGRDAFGTHSTGELAKLLDAPVILVVNCAKATRTIAALVKGCQVFDPEVNISGVVLNRVAGHRHAQVIKRAIKEYCNLPVLGTVPYLASEGELIPGRHLGLVPPAEYAAHDDLWQRLAAIADDHLDLDELVHIAESADELAAPSEKAGAKPTSRARVGYFEDSVFTFYYPENLEGLEAAGAELVAISSLTDTALPEIDALYLGGGFPETQAERLGTNRAMMAAVKAAADDGMPIYAECGGLIYLCSSITWGEKSFPMAGIFPHSLQMHEKPVGHGYVEARVDGANPYFETGTVLRGHEFHYSSPKVGADKPVGCLSMSSGVGLGGGCDGLVHRNVMACYTHIHADGVPAWAPALVKQALGYRRQRLGSAAEFRQAVLPSDGHRERKINPENIAFAG